MAVIFSTPSEMTMHIAKAAQAKRLSLNLSQQTLSERSGVSFGVLKKFERVGKISLESLVKIAFVLGCLEEFTTLFKAVPLQNLATLDELFKQKQRKRGRK